MEVKMKLHYHILTLVLAIALFVIEGACLRCISVHEWAVGRLCVNT